MDLGVGVSLSDTRLPSTDNRLDMSS
jgi:hypothetical protein